MIAFRKLNGFVTVYFEHYIAVRPTSLSKSTSRERHRWQLLTEQGKRLCSSSKWGSQARTFSNEMPSWQDIKNVNSNWLPSNGSRQSQVWFMSDGNHRPVLPPQLSSSPCPEHELFSGMEAGGLHTGSWRPNSHKLSGQYRQALFVFWQRGAR